MPEKGLKKQYPVYLDTNILYPLPITLDNPMFQILLGIAKYWDFNLYIPEVAYLEWVNKKKEDFETHLTRFVDTYNYLKAVYEVDAIDISRISSRAIFDKIVAVLENNLSDMNVAVIESCDMDTKELIDMSLKRIRPFEEKGEKGFRDSIILFTILRHAKSMGMPCLFISNDGVYRHPDIEKIAKKNGVSLSVFGSIEEFKEGMESLKFKMVDKYRKDELKKLSEFLSTRREQIIEFIRREGKFSITTLNMLFEPVAPDWALILSMIHEPPSPVVTPSIKKIINIQLLDIEAPSLPIETDNKVVPVYFWVKLRFLVSVERIFSPLYLFERRIGLSGEENGSESPLYERKLSEENIEGEFPIYADLKNEGEAYVDLVLKKVGENRFPSLGKDIFKKGASKA